MITLNQVQKAKIHKYSLLCYPNEMCGLLTEDDFISIPNLSEEPRSNFKLDTKAMLPYLGGVKAIVHSHCKNPKLPSVLDERTPSIADMEGQKTSAVPWLIVSCDGSVVSSPLQIPREPNNNYIGREFIWYVSDCYTLVQDYYKFELNILLPDHKAREDYRLLRNSHNLFDAFIEEYGFVTKHNWADAVNGDLVLLNHKGSVRNHLGIYHNGKIIHQDMLSVEIPFEQVLPYICEFLTYVA
jgi:proteasome lid subunit RPN8/RPN11